MTLRNYVIPLMLLAFAGTASADESELYTVGLPSSRDAFSAVNGGFSLNGEPFVIKAAELHYPRIPKEYWDHRIKMCKALGMNTICIYTFWNAHEPNEGEFDFSGQNNIREFIQLCEANDMKVILRPGPYVCAEWEMGGLPWWLLKEDNIRLRENDPDFIRRVDAFQQKLAAQVGDLTIDKGGPIIMMQVENEYGSYGTDPEYVALIRDILRKHFGNNITLFQCDWASNFENNGLPDLIWTMNFGTGADIDSQFSRLKELRPDSPLMCSEYWSGWFDKWGAAHETRPATEMIAGISEMLDKGISFSLYMTHGGTNWGHWAGANSPGFSPDVTSYDYDAPINEQGAPTEKYYLLRELMQKHSDSPLPEIPDPIEVISIPEFSLSAVAPLFMNLPEAKRDSLPGNMEKYGQGFGSILYRTIIKKDEKASTLTLSNANDYTQVFVNGRFIGKLDRRESETALPLPAIHKGDTLDILVEAMGRINFGRAIKDRKGVNGEVALSFGNNSSSMGGPSLDDVFGNWEIFNLTDDSTYYSSLGFKPVEGVAKDEAGRLPRGAYRGTFTISKPGDTFLDMSNFGKGLVYVNGHGLGRNWEIGPQQTLYLPGAWLREGENEIMIFDVIGPRELTVKGLSAPLLDQLNIGERHIPVITEADLSSANRVLSADLETSNGWKARRFEPVSTKSIILVLPAASDSNPVSLAEIYLLDKNGQRLSREAWKVTGISSEQKNGTHTGDKLFDLQESTFWEAEKSDQPSFIRIDLGKEEEISGIDLLPRMETGAPGAPSAVTLLILP